MNKTFAATRNGNHATVYDVMRDPKLKDKNIIRDKKKYVFPFVAGSTYKGEWLDDKKNGFGTMNSPDGTIYEGDWCNDMKCGRGTLWRKQGKINFKEYTGEWKDDKMHGVGTFYHNNNEYYSGQWYNGQKSGRGKFQYADGSKYEGEYENDVKCGFGTFFCANGDVYEGYWLNDKKEGPGKYSYISTRKVYEGEWVNGQPKCGEYRGVTDDDAAFNSSSILSGFNAPAVKDESFDIPVISLQSPMEVLKESIDKIRVDRDERFGIA